MIHYGPYEEMCKGGIPENAVTRVVGEDTWVLYIPTEKGEIFHASTEPYVLGEGGRGSAKSTTLRWDAHLRNLMIPGHRALLLRRTFPQLRGSHFANVAKEGKQLGLKKDFNQSKYFLEYDNGSLLQFGHCESDAAIMDYLSQEWDWIGFDELTTFTFDQFIRISASARSTEGSGKMSFVRAATNPIGEGASWVKRYFIDRSITDDENPSYLKEEWRSIKMNLKDNPHMNEQEYRRKLLMLPGETMRRAYIDGEWLVEGQFFSQWSENKDGKPWHVIQELPTIRGVPIHRVPWVQITRAIDWGYSEAEPGWCGWFVQMPDGTAICFKEWVFNKHNAPTPEHAARKIVEMSRGLNIRFSVGDPMMWQERTGESIAETFAKNGLTMLEANNDRENGWVRLHSWLSTEYNDGMGPRPRLQFLAPQGPGSDLGVPYAIRTLPSLQTDPKKPRDITQQTGIEDHAGDGCRYWASNRPAPSIEPPKSLDWAAKEIRRSMGMLEDGEDMALGTESVGN